MKRIFLVLAVLGLLPGLVLAGTSNLLSTARRTDTFPVQTVEGGGNATRARVSISAVLALIDAGDVTGLQAYITDTLGIELNAKDDQTAVEIRDLLDVLFGSTDWRDSGSDGKTILSGTVDPTTEGVDGDYYLRTDTHTLFGPKSGGSWPAGVNLIGPTGSQGIQGPTGLTGATGPAGSDGLTALLVQTAESAGANCANGGQRIDVGLDDDRDLILDAGEIDQTTYVCNGADGADGAGSVDSVFGRTGAITAQAGDYTAAQIGAATAAQGSNADTAYGWGDHAAAGYLTSAPVTSVNSKTGAVVIDPDDLDDSSSTNKFVTDADVTNLHNLGTAAYTPVGNYATAAQGAKADTATQPGDLGTAAAADIGTAIGDVVGVVDVGSCSNAAYDNQTDCEANSGTWTPVAGLKMSSMDLPTGADYKVGGSPMAPADIGAATTAQGSHADTAYGWGNHAAAGYLTSAPVTSVAGKTGAVTLTASDVGLGNVPNVDATNANNMSSGTVPDARLATTIVRGTAGTFLFVSDDCSAETGMDAGDVCLEY